MKKAKKRVHSSVHVHSGTYLRLHGLSALCCSDLAIHARRKNATAAIALRAAGRCVFMAVLEEETGAQYTCTYVFGQKLVHFCVYRTFFVECSVGNGYLALFRLFFCSDSFFQHVVFLDVFSTFENIHGF